MKQEQQRPYAAISVRTEDIRNLRLFDALVLAYLRQDSGVEGQHGTTNVSNNELSKTLGSSVRYVSLSIGRLKKIGLLEQVSYNGVFRTLRVNT
jgi:hypothetical protein